MRRFAADCAVDSLMFIVPILGMGAAAFFSGSRFVAEKFYIAAGKLPIAAAVAIALGVLATPASATTILTVTGIGTVTSGTDAWGEFAPVGADLSGDSLMAVFTYDLSKAVYDSGGDEYGAYTRASGVSSFASAVVTIGGVSHSMVAPIGAGVVQQFGGVDVSQSYTPDVSGRAALAGNWVATTTENPDGSSVTSYHQDWLDAQFWLHDLSIPLGSETAPGTYTFPPGTGALDAFVEYQNYVETYSCDLDLNCTDTVNPGGADITAALTSYTVASSTVGGGTPEPSTWVLMTLGFAGLGYAAQRASRRAPAAA